MFFFYLIVVFKELIYILISIAFYCHKLNVRVFNSVNKKMYGYFSNVIPLVIRIYTCVSDILKNISVCECETISKKDLLIDFRVTDYDLDL